MGAKVSIKPFLSTRATETCSRRFFPHRKCRTDIDLYYKLYFTTDVSFRFECLRKYFMKITYENGHETLHENILLPKYIRISVALDMYLTLRVKNSILAELLAQHVSDW
jgi:hypothetical protein